eukprot:1121306-Pleurochrysis_carterae.AAC.1
MTLTCTTDLRPVIDLDPRVAVRHESGDARGDLVRAGRVLFRICRSSHQSQRRGGDGIIVGLYTNANRHLVSRCSFWRQEPGSSVCSCTESLGCGAPSSGGVSSGSSAGVGASAYSPGLSEWAPS